MRGYLFLRAISWFRSFPSNLVECWRMFSQLVGWSSWTRFIGYTRRLLTTELSVLVINNLLLPTLCPVLLGLTTAHPLLCLRQPRPPLSQVVRQSGFMICLIGIALVCLLLSMGDWWFSGVALTLGMTRLIISSCCGRCLACAPGIANRAGLIVWAGSSVWGGSWRSRSWRYWRASTEAEGIAIQRRSLSRRWKVGTKSAMVSNAV
jgi:hypothetical protein